MNDVTQAAGILFITAGNVALFMKRNDSGEWAIPAGGIEPDEEPEHAASREAAEETGHPGDHSLELIDRRTTNGVDFYTYTMRVDQFDPIMNDEHSEYVWQSLDDPPQPLHPGLKATLSHWNDAGPPDEPRDPHGMWTTGGSVSKLLNMPIENALKGVKDQIISGQHELQRLTHTENLLEHLHVASVVQAEHLDAFLSNHPVLKKVTGDVLGALELSVWALRLSRGVIEQFPTEKLHQTIIDGTYRVRDFVKDSTYGDLYSVADMGMLAWGIGALSPLALEMLVAWKGLAWGVFAFNLQKKFRDHLKSMKATPKTKSVPETETEPEPYHNPMDYPVHPGHHFQTAEEYAQYIDLINRRRRDAGFDPSEERDPHGMWTKGGGSDRWKLPPAPGTAPIPEGHVRLYHQTREENLGAIKHQGLMLSHAKGSSYGEPNGIWASETGFYGSPDQKPTVEFHAPKERWTGNWLQQVEGDVQVSPKDIIAIHRPWHEHARYAEEDPRVVKAILAGEHDDLLHTPGYGKSTRYIKHKYGGSHIRDAGYDPGEARDPHGQWTGGGDEYHNAIEAMKPHLGGSVPDWQRTALTPTGELAYPDIDAKLQTSAERNYHRLREAVSTLRQAISAKQIPNATYNEVKSVINHNIERAVEGKNSYQEGKPGLGMSMLMVSNATELAREHKRAIKEKNEVAVGFLGQMLPLAKLLEEAKPLIFKRGMTPAGEKLPPARERERLDPAGNPLAHCQICGRQIEAANGLIAHHGYHRPGMGWQTPSCFGARKEPYEVSRDAIKPAIEGLTGHLNGVKKALTALVRRPPSHLEVERSTGYGRNRKTEKVKVEKPDNFDPENRYTSDPYVTEYRSRKYGMENEITATTAEIDRLQKRYDDWIKVHDAGFNPDEPREHGMWTTGGSQTESPAFQSWFKNSKVVDEHGKPLVVYHGTSATKIAAFKTTGDLPWIYFSDNPKFAEKFSWTSDPITEQAPASTEKTKIAGPDGYIENINAWPSGVKGLVITNKHTSENEETFALTHEASGYAVSAGLTYGEARKLAEKVGSKIDWTISKEELNSQPLKKRQAIGRIAKKIKEERPDPIAAEFGWKQGAAGIGTGSNIIPAYLSLQNPVDLRELRRGPHQSPAKLVETVAKYGVKLEPRDVPFAGRHVYQMINDPDVANKIKTQAEAAGHDGVIFNDEYDKTLKAISYVAFHPSQIKSATGNKGTFDPGSPDIRDAGFNPDEPREHGMWTTGGSNTESPAFKKWFGSSKIVDDDDQPLVVYHGTTHDFEKFDVTKSDPESQWGAALYFTNEPKDVSINYAGVGPDLTNKIENRAKEIMSGDLGGGPDLPYGSPEYKSEWERARGQATKEFTENAGAVLPVYLKMEKPFDISVSPRQSPGYYSGKPVTAAPTDTRLSYEQSYDEKIEEYGEPTGEVVDFIEGIKQAASDYHGADVDDISAKIYEEAIDGGISSSRLDQIWRNDDNVSIAENDEGKLVSSEIFRRGLEHAGFDGVIDRAVSTKFHMEGMHPGVIHYTVFKPTQVKSAIGNKGTFDPKKPSLIDKILRDDTTGWTPSLPGLPEKWPYEIAAQEAAEEAEAKLHEALGGGLVCVAVSEVVCEECETAADDGPYTLDEFESMWPMHPNCLCTPYPYDEDEDQYEDAGPPDEPRNPHGEWTTGGATQSLHEQLTDRPHCKNAVDVEQLKAINEGLNALPADHARAIKGVEIQGIMNIGAMGFTTHGKKTEAVMGLSGFYGSKTVKDVTTPIIMISKKLNFKLSDRTVAADVNNPDVVIVHECGHALDAKTGNQLSENIGNMVIDEAYNGKMSDVWGKNSDGTPKTITDAVHGSKYFLSDPKEAFAEAYAAAYAPNKEGPYFGMDRPMAQLVFAKSLAKLRSMKLTDYIHDAASRLH